MNNKKTIAFYINSIHFGGAERVIIQLSYRFYLAGYNSILITSFADKGFEYNVPNGVKRICLEEKEIKQSKIKRNISRIIKLRKILKQYKPSVLISFMAEPNIRAIFAATGLNVKTIVSVRNDPKKEYRGFVGYLIGHYILPLSDGCVFQTIDAKKWFPKRLQKKSQIIMNEVSESFFKVKYNGGSNIVTFGRLTEQKNHELLIRSFSEIADMIPNTNLEIYGKGELEKHLKFLIKDLKMEDRIKLNGITNDVESILSNSACFVLSSNYEGMPNSLLEALTVGIPSISTDCPCGGPKNIIKNNENGILVSVNDKEALKTAILRIMNNKDFSSKISEKSRDTSKQFHPDNVFNDWNNYVHKILKSK